MRKAARKILRVAGFVFGGLLVLALAAVLLVLFDKPLVKKVAVKYLAGKTGVALTVGKLDYTASPLHVTLTSVKAVYTTPVFTVTVDARRLEAAGSLKKLLSGTMPALDFVEADIAELRFEQAKVSEEPVDFATIIPRLGNMLAMASKTKLTCGVLELKVPGQHFRIDALALSAARTSTAPADRTFTVQLDTGGASAAMTPGDLTLQTRLHAGGALTLAPTAGLDLRLALDSPQARASGRTVALERIALDAVGSWKLKEGAVSLAKWAVDAPRLANAEGNLTAELGKSLAVSGEGRVRVEDLASAAVLLKPFLPPELREAQVRGGLLVSGRGRLAPGSERKPPEGDIVASLDRVGVTSRFQGVPFDFEVTGNVKAALAPGEGREAKAGELGRVEASLEIKDARAAYGAPGRGAPGQPLSVRLAGQLRASGTRSDLKATADIRASTGPIVRGGVSIGGASVLLQASGSKTAVGISRFEAVLAKPSAALSGGKTVAFAELKLGGRAGLDLATKSLALDALEASVPTLPPLRLQGRFDLYPRGTRKGSLQWHGLPVPALRSMAAPFLPAGLGGWDFDGAVDLDVTGSSVNAAGRRPATALSGWEISGALAVAKAKFNDPSFAIAGEKLESAVKFDAARGEPQGAVDWSASVDLKHGESLWKSFYVKWDERPLRADLSGRFDPAAKTLDDLAAKVVLQTVGELQATGTARLGPPPSFRLRMGTRVDLGPFYALSTQAGAAEGRLKVAGTVGGQFDIARDGGSLAVKGRLTGQGIDVESPASKILLKGVAADIPVDYFTAGSVAAAAPGGPPETAAVEKGTLEAAEIKTPFADIPALALKISGQRNAWRIDPVAVELFGASLELGATSLALDPKTGSLSGRSSLSLPSLDLSRLPGVSPKLPLSGVVHASFPSLVISGSSIAMEGRAEADIFGGKVIVRDVSVADPFKPGRAISANVDILDIDLKKATDVIPFGEMTGIVRGEIRDLTLSYGQPESFLLRLESVPRKGVAQTFSLKAVDNLTVLSSGQSATGGTGSFWMKFIRGFRYEKLGIVSTLRNDTFTLNGTVHERGVEYLVKKPPLFGINVINRMPEKKISFKEMMSRLERVGQSESPQVKK